MECYFHGTKTKLINWHGRDGEGGGACEIKPRKTEVPVLSVDRDGS